MSWSQRQQGMLRALGLRVWTAADDTDDDSGAASLTPHAAAPVDVVSATVAETPPTATTTVTAPTPPAAERPLVMRTSIANLDWPDLRQTVAGCTACTLCESRTQTVFGMGHAQAHWLVVGEAPGEQEDKQGLPFVGPSGQLLDRMLAALQLTRCDAADAGLPAQRRVYIANTVKCRPPRNRNPSAEELSACEPYLVRQIQLLQPRIILAMGAFAIKALLRSDEPVGRLRGRVHQYQGVPLVVSYHPAYLLRQPQEKAKAWEDLCLAADTVANAAAT